MTSDPKQERNPDRLKINDPDWESAVDKAMKKPKPPDGWPPPEPKRVKRKPRPEKQG